MIIVKLYVWSYTLPVIGLVMFDNDCDAFIFSKFYRGWIFVEKVFCNIQDKAGVEMGNPWKNQNMFKGENPWIPW